MAVRSASVFCVFVATSRRALPTFTVSHTNSGVMKSDRTVSCQERINMAMSELMITTTFDRMLEAVSVTTLCTPPTSFARRDWISPGAGRGEEPQRHELQVPVERVAEVLHHPQPHQVRQVGLADADGAGDDGDGDHERHEHVHDVEVGGDSLRSLRQWSPWSKTARISRGLATPRPEVTRMAIPTTPTFAL